MKILDTVNRDLTEAIRKQDRERLKASTDAQGSSGQQGALKRDMR